MGGGAVVGLTAGYALAKSVVGNRRIVDSACSAAMQLGAMGGSAGSISFTSDADVDGHLAQVCVCVSV